MFSAKIVGDVSGMVEIEVLLQVGVLTELAHGIVLSRLKDSAGIEAVLEDYLTEVDEMFRRKYEIKA
jgi:hypothetical protein